MNQLVRENTPSSLDDEPVGLEFRDREEPQQENFEINVPQKLSPKPKIEISTTTVTEAAL